MFAFSYSKTAISFNILLVLQILCRYNGMLVGLHVPTNSQNNCNCPPACPLPPLATLVSFDANCIPPGGYLEIIWSHQGFTSLVISSALLYSRWNPGVKRRWKSTLDNEGHEPEVIRFGEEHRHSIHLWCILLTLKWLNINLKANIKGEVQQWVKG